MNSGQSMDAQQLGSLVEPMQFHSRLLDALVESKCEPTTLQHTALLLA
jgi:hypothetical protein